MFGSQFEYLRLQPNATKYIKLSPDYIKEGEDRLATRRIFQNVPYDDFEKRSIIQLRAVLQQININYDSDQLPDYVVLRFLYASQFIMNQAADLLKQHLKWLASDPIQLTDEVVETISSGLVYLAGRDQQLRPTIVIDLAGVNPKQFYSEKLFNALIVVMAIAEDYMFIPGYIENWKIIIETAQMELYQPPLQMHLQISHKPWRLCISCIHRKVLGLIGKQWHVITKTYLREFIDPRTLKKIQVLNVFSPSANGFDNSQLEKRFNGTMPNMTELWMPKNTVQLENFDKIPTSQLAKLGMERPQQSVKQLTSDMQTQADPLSIQNIDPVKEQFAPNSKIGAHVFSSAPFLHEIDHGDCPYCQGVFQILNKPPNVEGTVMYPSGNKTISQAPAQSSLRGQNHNHQGPANIPCAGCDQETIKAFEMGGRTVRPQNTQQIQTQPTIQYPPLRMVDGSQKTELPWYIKSAQQQQQQSRAISSYPNQYANQSSQNYQQQQQTQQSQFPQQRSQINSQVQPLTGNMNELFYPTEQEMPMEQTMMQPSRYSRQGQGSTRPQEEKKECSLM